MNENNKNINSKNKLGIKAFKSVRPNSDYVKDLVSLPYDVMDRDEARILAQNKEFSFLRIIRADLEFPNKVEPHSKIIYEKAKENYEKFKNENILIKENSKSYYIYEMTFRKVTQRGLVALFSNEAYRKNLIKKHELTRPVKEQDRVDHIICVGAQLEPVFLLYKNNNKNSLNLTNYLNEVVKEKKPLYNIEVESEHFHALYKLDVNEKIEELVSNIETLYIADGHHRSSAASLCELKSNKDNLPNLFSRESFLAVAFPDTTTLIYPYYRVVNDLNGYTKQEFIKKIGEAGISIKIGHFEKMCKNQINMYLENNWYMLEFDLENFSENSLEIIDNQPDNIKNPPDNIKNSPENIENSPKNLLETLTVNLLQNKILAPILNVTDPRTSERIQFIGGIHGETSLEEIVNSGKGKVAFSMSGVVVEDLIKIADNDLIMPPKSTWFEPKLRSGFVIHDFDINS